MVMKHEKGIPTLYRGIRFRSRTEARIAAFFDEVGWTWTYEPFDLDGYIPDFVLHFDDPLLVEVKAEVIFENLSRHERKIERSGWTGEALIVGAELWEAPAAQPIIGLFGERHRITGELEWSWGEARLFGCLSCGALSVLAGAGSWRCRACGEGEGEGNEHVGLVPSTLGEMWARATNRVQWRRAG